MQIKNYILKAVREVKILRYRTYKELGFLGKRKNIDRASKALFVLVLALTTLSLFFMAPPSTPPNVLTNALIANPDDMALSPKQEQAQIEVEQVPEPPKKTASLNDLEKGVNTGIVNLKTLNLKKKETLSGLLGRAKVNKTEHQAISDALAMMIDLKTIKPDAVALIFTDKKGEFLAVSVPRKAGEVVAVLKEDDGTYTPFAQEGRIETKNVQITGKIERTFSGSAKKAGVPAALVSQIMNVMAGDVDFSTFKPGDSFDVIFERKATQSGLELGSKQLLYVGLKIGKRDIHRYAWTDKGGITTFYNPKGQGSSTLLLKRPAKAKVRLSSPYGWRRHPVLMYNVFHSGVDLACPMNTPIVAAGDGVITQLGRKGAYGKYIRIRHSNGFETAYGHMNGYKEGLKIGSRVKRGDTIGYVGTTGRSTGPHVHFEVWKNGRTIQPFNDHVLMAKQLIGAELERFQQQAKSLHPDFSAQLIGKVAPLPPKKPKISGTRLPNLIDRAFVSKEIMV